MKIIREPYVAAAFSLIIILALAMRVYGLDFPRYHWDENIGFGNVFYASFNGMRMNIYDHGSFYPYLMLVVWSIYMFLNGEMPTTYNLLATFIENAAPLVLLARGLIVLAGTANVVVVYWLGKRLYNAAIGLLAAFFLALTFLHASESHYARGHILAALFATLSVLFTASTLAKPHPGNYVLAGVSAGLATAAQYSSILVVLPILVAHFAKEWPPRWQMILNRSFLLGLTSAAAAFFLVTPYALLDFHLFSNQIRYFLFSVISHTWVSSEGQPVWLFYLTEHLWNGMGPGLLLVALAGVAYALYCPRTQEWVLLSFPIPLFITFSKGENFARYALLLLPFLCIVSARILYDVVMFFQPRIGIKWAYTILIMTATGIMIPSVLTIVRFDYWLTQRDTRQLASQWIVANVPFGVKFVIEGAGVLGPPLPLSTAQLDLLISSQPDDTLERLMLQAIRERTDKDSGFHVELVYRLDQAPDGSPLMAEVPGAQVYTQKKAEYLVTVDWMKRDEMDRYTDAFQLSLDAFYEPLAEFRPSIAFRFDPYAWRMDYDALKQVVVGQPGIGGPPLTIYRLRDAVQASP